MTFRMAINKRQIAFFYLLILSTPQTLHAAELNTTTLSEVVVSGKVEEESRMASGFMPAVEGTHIYDGKKTSVIDLEAAPTVVNSNFRQVLQKTPGLLLSEESTPLLSVGYRGLDPHRAQFTQVLKDGIPIHADMLGYPEAYYVPPVDSLDRVDFIRGGASLMYGPQPGGAINFVTHDPYEGAFQMSTSNSIGSHNLFSDYTAFSGTSGAMGHYSYFHHRQSQGFRDFNSQYEVYSGGSKIVIRQDDTAKWTVGFDLYAEEHGEPGGLTRADFDRDPSITKKLVDHFELNRYAGNIFYEKEIDEATLLELKGYGIYYERLSWRQRGGGFGTVASGANASTNDIENQEFYTGGLDGRVKHDWKGPASSENTLSVGFLYHHTTSPRIDERGLTADALDGTVRKDADRSTDYLSLFAENMFQWGRFSITPGFRLENVWQDIRENINLDKTTVPLANESVHDVVPLGGVAAALDVTPEIELYGNFSQAYRPMIFTQAVPNGTNQVVNDNLKEGRSWQSDVGVRGTPLPFVTWDAGLFYMEFDDQIGSATIAGQSTVQNVGDARHQGAEIFSEIDLVGLSDSISGTNHAKTIGNFALFYNAMFLEAEFTGGPNTGKTPQYAPNFIQKAGVEYRWQDRVKVRFAGTFVDEHFADDNNTTQRIVPSYKVWDLTGEWTVCENVSLFAGINNMFNEHYFARVRSDGIDPADGRNYYGGAKLTW